MRYILLIAIALGAANVYLPCFAANDAGSDAPDLDIGTLVSEGQDLSTQAKNSDAALEQLADEGQKIQADKIDSTKDLSAYDQTAAAFHTRCKHQFVEGQESELANCQAEYDQILQVFKHLEERQSEIHKSLSDWQARKAKVDQQKADIALRLESWKHRMKALLVAKGMSDCGNAVATSAGSGDSYAELRRLVNGYQHCWDGAGSAQEPPRYGATQGSPVFSAGTSRTAEQAIADYKTSGNADPGASPKRGLDQASVPLPATAAQP